MRLSENRILVISVLILLSFPVNVFKIQTSSTDFTTLSGPYLGQKPPGMVPEIFAPGIISVSGLSEGCSGFSKNADLFLFKRYSDSLLDIYITELKNGKWSQPVNFIRDSESRDGDFTFAPDGKTLYFTSRRPVPGSSTESADSNIWKTVFSGQDWSEPVMIDGGVNSDSHDSYPSVTKDGTMYFFSRRPGGLGKSDIYVSRMDNGKYLNAVNPGNIINTEYDEWDPFIAHDESFLIFCSTKSEGYGNDDFYITFKNNEGSWSEPVNMGDRINSSESENRPYITPDGKYFFFTSTRTGDRDIYWVDAAIIEKFRLNK